MRFGVRRCAELEQIDALWQAANADPTLALSHAASHFLAFNASMIRSVNRVFISLLF